MTENISQLLAEAYSLKERMAADKARLAEINKQVFAQAEFDDTCKTTRLAASGYIAKVQRKEVVSWNQETLRKAVAVMGVKEFSKLFDYEYKPKSSKVLKDYLANPSTPDEFRTLLDAARSVKEGAPSITYEWVEE